MTSFLTRIAFISLIMSVLSACGGNASPVAVVTIPATQIGAGAPVYTATPTLTPSHTPTASPTPTATETPTITPTASHTPTSTATPTDTPTQTPSPSPTTGLLTPTPIILDSAPSATSIAPASFSATQGWSCGDFPCEDDIAGFLQRIQVPAGFELAHVGRFGGQVVQLLVVDDGRLFATVLEDGTRSGAVYIMYPDARVERYSETIISPAGLAFQPGTDVLYVSGRTTPDEGGALYRVDVDGRTTRIVDDLPCCYQMVWNQPNGMIFGADGWLYLGIGALTDRAESSRPGSQPFAEIVPNEAGILRINPHTGMVEPYVQGLHNPVDLTVTSRGQLFATDMGLVTGEGDRIVEIRDSAHYGWPYYRTRGCAECPPRPPSLEITPDLLTLANYSIPQGITAYTGNQFPSNMQDTLFIALWNGVEWGQQVIWLDPNDPRLGSDDYQPQPFVTGLIRPSDVVVASDGSLLVADFIYGHVWRVSYGAGTGGQPVPTAPSQFVLPTNTPHN
ncbi:MAG: PQQ-dependent sugar dehydrogenase [Anaerolineae bacterium]